MSRRRKHCAIFGINRRRVVFVTQPAGERQSRRDAKTVVDEKVVTLGANLLWIIDARNARQERKAEQQICERIAGDLSERRKLKPPARLDVAKSVLL